MRRTMDRTTLKMFEKVLEKTPVSSLVEVEILANGFKEKILLSNN